ncbi:MAG TPA: uracil-DNA glycosylase [Steroidobacteraceae bacterium]
MDSRRLAYLRAMDIDVWERRDRVPTHSPSIEPVAARPEPQAAAAPQVGRLENHAAGMGWEALELAVRSCQRCPLHATRTQGVFGVGNRRASWFVIGEAPGADEDRQGEPFVGRAGQLLNSMLKAIGLAREEVYIANILKSRPPNNRDPRPEEVRECIPYLYRQIELVNPKLILCVGRIAAQTLLGTDTPIGKLRGKLHHLPALLPGGQPRPMVVTYHPAYLLRSPAEKRKAWSDLVLAMQTFERLGGTST